MPDRRQTYDNHRALPGHGWLIGFVLLGIGLVASGWNALQQPGPASIVTVLVLVGVLITHYQARRLAQVVQDRTIRLEMRLRLTALLPGRTDWQRFTLSQLVALRFASDGELPGLVDRVAKGELMTPNQIKLAITQWQADWLRV